MTPKLWWLFPAWPLVLIVGITLSVAYLQPSQAFEMYGMPKYVEGYHVVVGFMAAGCFLLGCILAVSRHGQGTVAAPPNERQLQLVSRVFWVSFGLSIFGYLVWLGVGLLNGFSLSMLVDLVAFDSPEQSDYIKLEVFPSLPGITTCAQFAHATIAIGLWLYYVRGGRTYFWAISFTIFLAFVRAFLVSERNALIELLFPCFFLWIRFRLFEQVRAPWMWNSFRLLPVVAPLVLVITFGAFEYVRSWRYYSDEFNSYAEFTTWRLSGYFTSAHNNAAMAMETELERPLPYTMFRPVWQFPGLPQSNYSYESLTGIEFEQHLDDMLINYGNLELNNEGGLFQPYLEFGLPLSLLFWCGYGYLAGWAYSAFIARRFWGLVLFPILYYSCLQVPLVLILLYTQSTPTLCMMVLAFYLYYRRSEPAEGGMAVGQA